MVRTVKGREIDMALVIAQYEQKQALGNANMNARGDIVDSSNRIIKARKDVIQEYYQTNPKAVKKVSLRDIAADALTPAQAIADLKKKHEAQKQESVKEPVKEPEKKSARKIVDTED